MTPTNFQNIFWGVLLALTSIISELFQEYSMVLFLHIVSFGQLWTLVTRTGYVSQFFFFFFNLYWICYNIQFSYSVLSDSVTPWTAARQASLSITNSQSLPKLMSIESVMPSNYLILCRPLLLLPSIFPSIRVFSNESALRMRWPSIGVSASTLVLPMNTQDWSPLGWTGWISLQFSNTTVQKHQFFGAQLSL